MKTLLLFLTCAASLAAQTLLPIHVSPSGLILDSNGKPASLRGLNRSGTGSGNADATATDADYAMQNQLIPMNAVRIFVNAQWWNSNTQVPIAGTGYQAYIDALIQRAKKYGNYVVILMAGQFPDAPCGSDGKNCPAPNQGDLNCAANAALCPAQDTTGSYIDTAFAFWAAFAQKYASDPAVLYDTWENMHSIDVNTWSNNQNQLIAAIRTYAPQALIFVEDTASAFEAIVAGMLPDLAWPNIVWNFHLYGGPAGTCTTAASPRYGNWPKNFDPLVTWAQQHGHAAGILEWGGCNDSEPYHTNITSYVAAHSLPLVYFDNTYLITGTQLTATGTKVAASYKSIASGGPGVVTSVSSVDGSATLAPEAIASAYGSGLAASTQGATNLPLPVVLGGASVVVTDVNGISRTADLFYASAAQINYQVPPGVATGNASVTVSVNGDPVSFGTAKIAAIAPGIYSADSSGKGLAAGSVYTRHSDGTSGTVAITSASIDLGATTDQVTLELFGTGVRNHSAQVTCKIGSVTAPVTYAGPQGAFVGLDQINVSVPSTLRGAGTQTIALTVDGVAANAVTVTFK
jgi:uncharacterized protein (TIGR03437 family)